MFDRNLQKRQLGGRAANRAEPLNRHLHERSCRIRASRIMGPQAITVTSARRSPHKHLELAILDTQKRTQCPALGNKRRRARQHPSRGPVPRDARIAISHKPAKRRIVGQADIHGCHIRFLSSANHFANQHDATILHSPCPYPAYRADKPCRQIAAAFL